MLLLLRIMQPEASSAQSYIIDGISIIIFLKSIKYIFIIPTSEKSSRDIHIQVVRLANIRPDIFFIINQKIGISSRTYNNILLYGIQQFRLQQDIFMHFISSRPRTRYWKYIYVRRWWRHSSLWTKTCCRLRANRI